MKVLRRAQMFARLAKGGHMQCYEILPVLQEGGEAVQIGLTVTHLQETREHEWVTTYFLEGSGAFATLEEAVQAYQERQP